MKNSAIVGGGLTALGVLLIVLGIGMRLTGHTGDDLPKSPAEAYAQMGDMSDEQQEKVVLSFSGYKPQDPRSQEADDVLRQMVKDTKVSPLGRAAAITALADKNDLQSLPDVADCLFDDVNISVRRAAFVACQKILRVTFEYDPNAAPADREAAANEYRKVARRTWQDKVGAKKK